MRDRFDQDTRSEGGTRGIARSVRLSCFHALLAFCGCSEPAPESWSYHGEFGPERWSEHSSAYELCGSGRRQSPVNLTTADAAPASPLGLQWTDSTLHLSHRGPYVAGWLDEGCSFDLEGARYGIEELHLHSPSEHTRDGRSSAMELQFHARSEDGARAVLAVLVEEGERHEEAAAWLDFLPLEAGFEFHAQRAVDYASLLPAGGAYYRYEGSLTKPPCTEGVTWIVMHEAIGFSKEQIEQVRARTGENRRPVQPRNDRAVTLVGGE